MSEVTKVENSSQNPKTYRNFPLFKLYLYYFVIFCVF